MTVPTLCWLKTRSTATASGRCSASIEASIVSRCSRRWARSSSGSLRTTVKATSRHARPGTPSTTPTPQRVSPGSTPSTRTTPPNDETPVRHRHPNDRVRQEQAPTRLTSVVTMKGMLALLGALTAVGPLSLDMYLPALPSLGHDLGASESQVQLTITACLIGIAAGQLFAGPLSDGWGRRRPVVAGAIAYCLATFLCALAPSVGLLTAARFVQGLAGGVGVVIARAIVRDLYSGVAAAKYFSRLVLVFGVAPIVAPSIGSAVLRVADWRGVFVVLGAVGGLIALAVVLRLPETLPPERRHAGGLRRIAGNAAVLGRDRVFVGYALTQ